MRRQCHAVRNAKAETRDINSSISVPAIICSKNDWMNMIWLKSSLLKLNGTFQLFKRTLTSINLENLLWNQMNQQFDITLDFVDVCRFAM